MKIITIDNKKYKLIPVKGGRSKVTEAEKSKVFAKPDWGFFAELTEEFLAQTMVLDDVKYHRHPNGGGWVSEKADVADTVWVGPFALVHNGTLRDQAIIHDRAIIDCLGLQEGAVFNIGEEARVSGSARVYGSAQVCGSARVYDSARVYGSAQVCGQGYLRKSTSEDIELKDWETIE